MYIVDTGAGAVNILISLHPFKSYIEAVRPLYSEFDVHSSILGSSSSSDISTIITSLADTENYLTGLSTSTCQLLGLKSALQGPHGVPAAQTVCSLHMLISFLQHLKTIMLKLNQGCMNDFSAASVLTLSNENLHCWIRLATETPTLLDGAHDFCRATHELIKK